GAGLGLSLGRPERGLRLGAVLGPGRPRQRQARGLRRQRQRLAQAGPRPRARATAGRRGARPSVRPAPGRRRVREGLGLAARVRARGAAGDGRAPSGHDAGVDPGVGEPFRLEGPRLWPLLRQRELRHLPRREVAGTPGRGRRGAAWGFMGERLRCSLGALRGSRVVLGRRAAALGPRHSHSRGGKTMDHLTRRTFLAATTVAAASGAIGPWVSRAGAQGTPVKIGLVLPYTGVYAVLGESITQAMELVFGRESWTVAGRKIEMIKEDDEMKPPVGLRKTEKLIDSDKVDILTGPVHSGILMGMRDKVHNSKTILIVSNAGADAISRERCSRWIFRTSFSNWQPCQPMGGWVAKNVSKEVFQIAPNYQAGKDMMAAFRETFLPAGGKVVAEDYPKLGETDYAPYLTKIKQSGAKAVFAFFSGTDAVNFVKQYDQFG